jgi:hypothetical protein
VAHKWREYFRRNVCELHKYESAVSDHKFSNDVSVSSRWTNSSGSATSRLAYVTVYPSATSTHTNWNYNLLSNFYSFHVSGVTTHVYAVQATKDFTNWVTLTNQTASFDFTNHLVTTNFPFRFFRTVY